MDNLTVSFHRFLLNIIEQHRNTSCFHRFLLKIIEKQCVFVDFLSKSLKNIVKNSKRPMIFEHGSDVLESEILEEKNMLTNFIHTNKQIIFPSKKNWKGIL